MNSYIDKLERQVKLLRAVAEAAQRDIEETANPLTRPEKSDASYAAVVGRLDDARKGGAM